MTVFLPTRLVAPLIFTITGNPAAFETFTEITRFERDAVARGSGAALTVTVKVRTAAAKVGVLDCVAVMVTVPVVIPEIVAPATEAIAGLLDEKLHVPVDWLLGAVIS